MELRPVFAVIAAMRTAYAELGAASIDGLTHRGLLAAQRELETVARQMPTQSNRMIARLGAEANPVERVPSRYETCCGIGCGSRALMRGVASRRPPTWAHVPR